MSDVHLHPGGMATALVYWPLFIAQYLKESCFLVDSNSKLDVRATVAKASGNAR
jgi:hypothetical protein